MQMDFFFFIIVFLSQTPNAHKRDAYIDAQTEATFDAWENMPQIFFQLEWKNLLFVHQPKRTRDDDDKRKESDTKRW